MRALGLLQAGEVVLTFLLAKLSQKMHKPQIEAVLGNMSEF